MQPCECCTVSTYTERRAKDHSSVRRPDIFSEILAVPLWRIWDNYIHMFTQRKLSFGGDRLPTLPRLARQFYLVLKYSLGREYCYLARLWDELLAVDCAGPTSGNTLAGAMRYIRSEATKQMPHPYLDLGWDRGTSEYDHHTGMST